MRVTITCEACGQRHRLLRLVNEPQDIWIVCHGCERSLRAELTASHALTDRFRSAWAETLDLAPSGAPQAS